MVMHEPESFWSPSFPDFADDFIDLGAPIFSTEFDLLDRAIELVVQSGAFSRPALAAALRLAERKSMRLTFQLETLGVIGQGDLDGSRQVLVDLAALPGFMSELRAGRRELQDSQAA